MRHRRTYPKTANETGWCCPSPVAENLVLNTYYKAPFAKGSVINRKSIQETAEGLVKEFDIRTPNATSAGSLSGGNQQKVIIARELSRPIQFLVASQPTRGLDVGSIEYIHNRIMDKRD